MNVFIIGSDSFIAHHFIQAYNQHYSIHSVSLVTTGFEREQVLPDFFSISDASFIKADIVLNFAAIVHRTDIKDETFYNEVNHKLTILNALKAKKSGVKLFVQMSTVAVYGDASHITCNTPVNPRNSYGRSKLLADEELLSMQDDHFKVAVVRPPMVYGGGRAPGNMLRLIRLADKGLPLPFKGINNKRDFINVHNLVQYLAIIAQKQLNGIHLISDHEPVSTEYLLHMISKHLGKKIPLFSIPAIGLKLLKKIRPNEYNKLFGTLSIETAFPNEDMIKRFTVEGGIREMVESYIKTIKQP